MPRIQPHSFTYSESVAITNDTTTDAALTIPEDAAGTTPHVILEAVDDGTPSLTSYRRLVIDVSG